MPAARRPGQGDFRFRVPGFRFRETEKTPRLILAPPLAGLWSAVMESPLSIPAERSGAPTPLDVSRETPVAGALVTENSPRISGGHCRLRGRGDRGPAVRSRRSRHRVAPSISQAPRAGRPRRLSACLLTHHASALPPPAQQREAAEAEQAQRRRPARALDRRYVHTQPRLTPMLPIGNVLEAVRNMGRGAAAGRFQVPGSRCQGSEKTPRRASSRNPEPATWNRSPRMEQAPAGRAVGPDRSCPAIGGAVECGDGITAFHPSGAVGCAAAPTGSCDLPGILPVRPAPRGSDGGDWGRRTPQKTPRRVRRLFST